MFEMMGSLKIETIFIAGLQGKLALANNSSNITGLVIMLHGWSINSDYMSNFFPLFVDKCHNIAFYAPDAPYTCPHVEYGKQWFDFDPEKGVDFYNHNQNAELSTKIIECLIMGASKKFKLPLSKIILSGYSQGGIMTLAEGTRHNLAGLLIFSGVVLTANTLQTASSNSPEILLIHGEQDDVIPLSALEHTKVILLEKNYRIETFICKDAGHSMSELSMCPAIKFILDRI